MFALQRPARRLVGAAAVGVALAAAPAMAALNDAPSQPVAEPVCAGAESIVDGKPTCVSQIPAPAPPKAGRTGTADDQAHDGGHH